jgi:hypothetical protein
MIESEMRFKNHAKVVHGKGPRTKVIKRMRKAATPPESVKSTPKIIVTRRVEKLVPSPSIVLRVGRE